MASLNLGKIIKAVRNTDLIITPRLNEYLIVHGDDPIRPDIAGLIVEEMTKKPRDRSRSFSASSAGQCPRKQELQFLGMPQTGAIDPQLAMIFADGKWRHMRWQAILLQAGLLDKIEMPLFWRSRRSRGSIDGLGTVPDDHARMSIRGLEYGFELKGTNPYVYQKAVKQEDGTKEEHKRQVARYFLMGGFDLFVTIYENKATQEWFEWVEFPDQKYIDQEIEELKNLNRAIETQTLDPMLPTCQRQIGDFNECEYGGVQGACIRARNWPNIKGTKPKKNKNKKGKS